jgi:hypothetical protein
VSLGIVTNRAYRGPSVIPIGNRCDSPCFLRGYRQPEINNPAPWQFPETNFVSRKNTDDAKVPAFPRLQEKVNARIAEATSNSPNGGRRRSWIICFLDDHWFPFAVPAIGGTTSARADRKDEHSSTQAQK